MSAPDYSGLTRLQAVSLEEYHFSYRLPLPLTASVLTSACSDTIQVR